MSEQHAPYHPDDAQPLEDVLAEVWGPSAEAPSERTPEAILASVEAAIKYGKQLKIPAEIILEMVAFALDPDAALDEDLAADNLQERVGYTPADTEEGIRGQIRQLVEIGKAEHIPQEIISAAFTPYLEALEQRAKKNQSSQ